MLAKAADRSEEKMEESLFRNERRMGSFVGGSYSCLSSLLISD